MEKILKVVNIGGKNYEIYGDLSACLKIRLANKDKALEAWAKKYLSDNSSSAVIYYINKRKTYAFHFFDRIREENSGECDFGRAVCHKQDSFNREIGMAIALARLNSDEELIPF